MQTVAQRNTLEGSTGFVGADVGDDHGCVIRGDGRIYCWGSNAYGQLGLGSTSPSTQATLSQASVTGSLVYPISVAAGGNHSCAVDINGAVQCWGANSSGQLGNGNTTDQLSPVVFQIPSGRRARQVSAGYTFTCALLDDNSVYCAGSGGVGQLGDGGTSDSATPVQVKTTSTTTLSGVMELTTGDFHACARMDNGTVVCWGAALGNGSSSAQSYATNVSGATFARSISASGTTTCTVTAGGEVSCWGANADGQLGDGTTTSRATPATVSGLSNMVAVGVGVFHTCAVQADGDLYCWGKNGNGQVGNGTTSSSVSSPAQVSYSGGSNGTLGVLGGYAHTCSLTADGLFCWGSDSSGQLGNGTSLTGNQTSPTAAALPVFQDYIPPFTFVDTASTFHRGHILDVGENHSCMVVPAGSFVNVSGSATNDGPSSSRVATTGVACWGQNAYGQLGTGNTTSHNRPRWVTGLPAGPKAVATGANHSCALFANGRMRCWGRNNYGQLGDRTTTDRSTPVEVMETSSAALGHVIAIAAGDEHTCALLADGTLRCWGRADDHRLGHGEFVTGGAPPTGARSEMQTVRRCSCLTDCNCDAGSGPWDSSLVTADLNIAITAGGAHTCSLRVDGTSWCWGRNTRGQVGRAGDLTETSTLDEDYVRFAKRVEFASGVSPAAQVLVSISAGGSHTCGVNPYGTTWCWGDNAHTQASSSAPTSAQACRWDNASPPAIVNAWCTPVDNSGRLSGVHAVSAGGDTTCALRNTASAYSEAFCWGSNDSAQAGTTTSAFEYIAQQIRRTSTDPIIDSVVRIATSPHRSCALGWDGSARCWGRNNANQGELGRGPSTGADGGVMDPLATPVVDLGHD